MACAVRIVKGADSYMLAVNGRHIEITKDRVKCLLRRMGFVNR